MGEDSKNKKIIGPSLPPEFERNSVYKFEEDIVTPKKVYGPSRPFVEESSQKSAAIRRRSRSPPSNSDKSKPGNIRESWMIEMTSQNCSTLKLDPLNIKSRTFIQSRTDSYEKAAKNETIDPEIKATEGKIDDKIKEYNEVHRLKTLQEIYEEEHMGKKDRRASDYQERIFDWERDMNSTVRQMSSKSAKDLVNKSTLNDRFGSSSSKKYL